MNESQYQAILTLRIRNIIPECFVLKTDPRDIQGIPDLLILYKNKWAALEVKISPKAPVQPNQIYYVEKFDELSFAAFINPENEMEVLDALQRALGVSR